ncbi:MAG: hypothetical protein PHT94_01065 [Candidatus Nanoarchaeia archaeon]|nr:hypothetical protein [Candidatus Nanoarchaeia archaeon]
MNILNNLDSLLSKIHINDLKRIYDYQDESAYDKIKKRLKNPLYDDIFGKGIYRLYIDLDFNINETEMHLLNPSQSNVKYNILHFIKTAYPEVEIKNNIDYIEGFCFINNKKIKITKVLNDMLKTDAIDVNFLSAYLDTIAEKVVSEVSKISKYEYDNRYDNNIKEISRKKREKPLKWFKSLYKSTMGTSLDKDAEEAILNGTNARKMCAQIWDLNAIIKSNKDIKSKVLVDYDFLNNVKKEYVQSLLDDFALRPSKTILDEFKVVITRHPYDILGKSTDRRWKSCMRLPDPNNPKDEGGQFHDYVFKDIEYGTIETYLISKNDKYILNPYGRMSLYPFQRDDEFVLYHQGKVYSDGTLPRVLITKYIDCVTEWVDNINKDKDETTYSLDESKFYPENDTSTIYIHSSSNNVSGFYKTYFNTNIVALTPKLTSDIKKILDDSKLFKAISECNIINLIDMYFDANNLVLVGDKDTTSFLKGRLSFHNEDAINKITLKDFSYIQNGTFDSCTIQDVKECSNSNFRSCIVNCITFNNCSFTQTKDHSYPSLKCLYFIDSIFDAVEGTFHLGTVQSGVFKNGLFSDTAIFDGGIFENGVFTGRWKKGEYRGGKFRRYKILSKKYNPLTLEVLNMNPNEFYELENKTSDVNELIKIINGI